jgi:hypothetical protein
MKRQLTTLAALCCLLTAAAQEPAGAGSAPKSADEATVSGIIQSDMLVPQNDKAIGATKDGNFNTNTYIDVLMQSRYVDAGGRFEYKEQRGAGCKDNSKVIRR